MSYPILHAILLHVQSYNSDRPVYPQQRCAISGTASHQLSATALLPSPDGSRHPLDVYEFMEDDIPGSLSRRGGSARHGRGLWECLIGCRHKVNEQLARRMVEQGVRLYNQHKHQAAVMKWRNALKRIRKRDDKFNLIGYLYQAYMDWGKYR
ncbi:unnamed protein product [Timema podura]|uniref:Rapsyn myristoylation/linker region N-terminal domain-containing protein n=1 Tax=Timema podura TaxID=61482 RepID=A0ABN7NIP9_TIMPD|nr:unnamed protein product [Timema podura]